MVKRLLVIPAAIAAVLFFSGSRSGRQPGWELLRAQTLADNGFRSLARYRTEEDAVRVGRERGVGTAVLEGPAEVQVDSFASWTLRFRAGRAGMKQGGGIRLAFAHGMGVDWGGLHLQTADPSGENFLTVRSQGGAQIQVVPRPWRGGAAGTDETFLRYFPWQHITEFIVADKPLVPGEVVEIGIGDRRGGSPGVRVQKRDESAFVFKLYVDPQGDDDYLPLENSPAIRIRGGPARSLIANTPAWAPAGKPAAVTAWISDSFANPASGFSGTLRLECDDPSVDLPGPYRFVPQDNARHRFENIVFRRPGIYRLRIVQEGGDLSAVAGPIEVSDSAPPERIFWGDIHTHTRYSDGRGSLEETYRFGRDYSALDFCAVTDHAFLVSDEMWREIKEVANRFNRPSEYVTFLAYEWSGMTEVGGDHNVYFRGDDAEITRSYSYYDYRNLRMHHGPNHGANHVEELFRVLSDHLQGDNIMAIPHFGGRRGNPQWHNPAIQRLIEVFSDHRRSEDWVRGFLDRRYRIGIMASTDNHDGNAGYGFRGTPGEASPDPLRPGEQGTALVGVYAPEQERTSIFDALYRRHTYATTGSRILLDFRVNGRMMGEEIRSTGFPRIAIKVEGTAPVERVLLLRNSQVIFTHPGTGASSRFEYVDRAQGWKGSFYHVRVEQSDGEQAVSSPIWVD